MSLAFLALVAALLAVAPVSDDGDVTDLQAGLGVLAYFEATAVVLNPAPRPPASTASASSARCCRRNSPPRRHGSARRGS